MTPTLEFLERNPGLMAEMIADFQQRKNIVDAAKSKEPIDANVIDNPNLRAQIPYPKMMYNHRLHTTLTVQNREEHEAALRSNWSEQPWLNVDPGVPIGPQSTSDPMAEERLDTLERQMLDMQQALGDILAQLQLLNRPDPERRKPGRPPNNPQA